MEGHGVKVAGSRCCRLAGGNVAGAVGARATGGVVAEVGGVGTHGVDVVVVGLLGGGAYILAWGKARLAVGARTW